jgi:hypothetical protein
MHNQHKSGERQILPKNTDYMLTTHDHVAAANIWTHFDLY